MNICQLTTAAKEQILSLCQSNNVWGISLNLKGGGCAGFEYQWDTVQTAEDVQAGDFVINVDTDANFVIGSQSLMFLAGTEVDYVNSLVGSNFEIRNPNAQSSCGCGVSVNFDMEKLPDLTSSAV